ncbi:MAG: bifunctional 23S rRNA (guanine(2069)-N(7))-methyltransferase RlmK/23S rRNA (guanine(2445)-N(2))-methyltransferase RlmL [Spirochaetia bacterium]|nr:bifunctional 23S rRNA (guanine(2069)-N(7))-methyltransferase RlmK/23S rRNA (guanine(2445)-N(2))-methyltransferase RlmL [Spirochaetia bacterium]MCF7941624.1 bifunctional 23S rRNA (guanine(2069)-N(7))-methyltransferase RlmK/23S rRNA (guanine(2445)-N(2))-methyltransferase RlmL [Spirochaetia bacterium]
MKFFAQTAANINDITASEARDMGADKVKLVPGGVQFTGDLALGYRFCLWSRTASRLLLELSPAVEGRAPVSVVNKDTLYDAAYAIAWDEHMSPDMTFAVTATATKAGWLKNSQFGALRVKDAIVDYMRHKFQERPDVDAKHADVIFHMHLNGKQALFYLVFSGQGMHKRGYRIHQSEAMLKEHLAAAVIMRSGFKKPSPDIAALLDPFAGMGTIPIEAAMIAADIAPGLLNTSRFGFEKWPNHVPAIWKGIIDEAEARKLQEHTVPPIHAWDRESEFITYAQEHAEKAGVAAYITFAVQDFTRIHEEFLPDINGMIITDPPYGMRMGSEFQIHDLYKQMGEQFPKNFPGWSAHVLCGDEELLNDLQLRPSTTNILYNGPIKCVLAHYEIFDSTTRDSMIKKAEDRKAARLTAPLDERSEMCANRMKKNRRMLKAYLKREEVSCYRLYDADIPEFSAAVDVYENRWVHVQEYAPPKTIDPRRAESNLKGLIDAVNRVTDIDYSNIFVKQRKQQKGSDQYEKIGTKGQNYIIHEHGLKFLVNFSDYIDTGIFLDHRPTRKLIKEMADNCRFLNLFAYTGTATVHAAAGGALSTVTVDSSATYLKWAEENMRLNGYGGMNHFYYKSDCITWLQSNKDQFDLIFLDPPTFSNSKSRKDSFDVQQDHRGLIMLAMRHLTPNGTLIFSNNFRKFVLDARLEQQYLIEEITDASIPEDFVRNQKIHRCWLIRPKHVIKVPSAAKRAVPARKIKLKKQIRDEKPQEV